MPEHGSIFGAQPVSVPCLEAAEGGESGNRSLRGCICGATRGAGVGFEVGEQRRGVGVQPLHLLEARD
eukprot:scaffold35401_cov96-Isochrysis_galbana.AAC.1